MTLHIRRIEFDGGLALSIGRLTRERKSGDPLRRIQTLDSCSYLGWTSANRTGAPDFQGAIDLACSPVQSVRQTTSS